MGPAAESTAGFSLAITGSLQAAGDIEPGVWTPDECMPAAVYIDSLARRNVMIRENRLSPVTAAR